MIENRLWIKVGSGLAEQHQVGNKGKLLDKAARAGINVPKSIILLDTVWDQAILHGLIVVGHGQIDIPDPMQLLQFINLPKFDNPVAVRWAFSVEATNTQTLSGYFETVLRVDASDPYMLSDALVRVWASALRHQAQDTGEFPRVTVGGGSVVSGTKSSLPGISQHIRRDILIMEMVDAKHAGIAYSQSEYEDDLISYTTGTAEKLVAGKISGQLSELPKLRGWERKPYIGTLPTWTARVQGMLREVRRWMRGTTEWQVEWADDGEKCWLIQLRSIIRPPRRNEIFTLAHHKELLPPLPSVFMSSIIESCASELCAYFLRFDPQLPANRTFIEVFNGRPYFNLSLLMDMLRINGIPTRFITQQFGGSEIERHFALNLRRIGVKTMRFVLPRFMLTQLFTARAIGRALRKVQERAENPGTTFSELVATTQWLYVQLMTQMFSLMIVSAPLIYILYRTGTLKEHSARHQSIATRMMTDLLPLQEMAQNSRQFRESLEQGCVPENAEFAQLWAQYIATYGHRCLYEHDIAQPRYSENASSVLKGLAHSTDESASLPPRTLRGQLMWPLGWLVGRINQTHENWRHSVMRGFARVRAALLAKAAAEVKRGTLPSVDHIWLLTIDELMKLDEGWRPDTYFFERRLSQREHMTRYQMPMLIRRDDDLEHYRTPTDDIT